MYYIINLEKKKTIAATLTKNIMQKVCAITAIINMEETKNHGIALMTNYMPMVCAKIAILTVIIVREDKKKMMIEAKSIKSIIS